MPIEILLIAVLILLLISIVLNIFTYFKIEKEKNLILKELSNYTAINSSIEKLSTQTFSNNQQIQRNLEDLKKEITNQKEEIVEKLSAQIYSNSQQIQKNLENLKEEIANQKKEIYNIDKKVDEGNRKIEHIIKLLKEPLTEEDLK